MPALIQIIVCGIGLILFLRLGAFSSAFSSRSRPVQKEIQHTFQPIPRNMLQQEARAQIQFQNVDRVWRNYSSCSTNPQVLRQRMEEASRKYPNSRVRAVDINNNQRLLDIL